MSTKILKISSMLPKAVKTHQLISQTKYFRSNPSTGIKKRCFSSAINSKYRHTFEHYLSKNNLSKTDLHKKHLDELDEACLSVVKSQFGGSLSRAVSTLFPEVESPWKFVHEPVTTGYWKSINNQRKYLDELGKHLGVNTLDDWYGKVSKRVLLEHGGSNLIRMYNGSVFTTMKTVYPEHNWIPWKFSATPHRFWQLKENQRAFFDWLGKQVGVKDLDDWYPLLNKQLLDKYGGRGMLLYHKSLISALTSCYPEHNWIPWKFSTAQVGFWHSQENKRKFFDWLGKELGVKKLDDWYEKLNVKLVTKHGGLRLILLYKGSAFEALKNAYPEHNWIPWKFGNVTRGFWESKDNISKFVAELSEKLSIQTLDDWYRVDGVQLQKFGAAPVVLKHKGLYNLLKEQYPHHPWDKRRFQRSRKGQRWLLVTLKKMFPNEEILEDYTHPRAIMSASNRPLQLDVFIPSRSLAFEYQGIQHYEDIGVFSPSKTYQQRDVEKRTLCAANNIKLIEVPYWWNRTQESLQELLDTGSLQV